MSINAASILIDGTVSTTGGTATSLKTKTNDNSGHRVYLDDSSDLADQTEITFSTKEAKVKSDAPSGYTQPRNNLFVRIPFTVPSTGLVTYRTVKVEFADDIEVTDAQKLSTRVLVAQLLVDSDFTDFWDDQSRA